MKPNVLKKRLKLLMLFLWRSEMPINVSMAHVFMQQQTFTERRLLPGSLPGSGDTAMNKTQTSALQAELRDKDGPGKEFLSISDDLALSHASPVRRLL